MKLSKKKYRRSMHYSVKDYVMLLLTLLCTISVSAQFSITVVSSTPETCPGNGTITLSSQNADPGYPVNYVVYLLPDTATTIWNSTNPNVTGLVNGTYQVTATQIINSTLVSTPPQQVVITNNTNVVTYVSGPTAATCGPNGSINISVTNGTAASYEIISGPVTKPPQASNMLTGLPAGTYVVRVNDPCGFGVPQTVIVPSNEPQLTITPAAFPDIALPACDLITVKHGIAPTTSVPISFPLQITITVNPPGGGAPIVFTQNITNGNPDEIELVQVIPLYYGQTYTYTLVVSDPCNTYTSNHTVNAQLSASAGYDDAGCDGKLLLLTVNKFVPPYTVNFTSSPPDFVPIDENAEHPGPFMSEVIGYGEQGNAVPYGIYAGTITDACGRTATFNTEIIEQDIIPVVSTFAADCVDQLGKAEMSIPGMEISAAFITIAPAEYSDLYPLPDDVMEFYDADEQMVIVDILPPGTYVVVLTDICGNEYDPITFEIISSSPDPVGQPRVDCTEGRGTIRISSLSPPISQILITAAPAEFDQPLPHDASYNIFTNGSFYMDNLPPGSYTFQVTDDCATKPLSKVITAYSVLSSDVNVTRHCGSFDLYLAHNSTANASLSFWLQKYDEATGTWGHPGTGVPYVEGSQPDASNSYVLNNNSSNNTIPYYGEFRIIKFFVTYASGSVDKEKTCIEIIEPSISVPEGVIVESVVRLSCDGEAATDVQINAIGAEPLTYVIVEKDGDPFIIDNGTNDIFNDLADGTYKVQVSDPCGYSTPRNFTISDLPSVITANQAGNLSKCDSGNDNLETFDLTAQTPIIIGSQNAATITVTYHSSLADAEAGVNLLPTILTTGNMTVYARAVNSVNTNCFDTTSFDITLAGDPVLTMADSWPMCHGSIATIIADSGFATYEWSTGETSAFIIVTQGGPYWVKVTTPENCTTTKNFTVIESYAPQISQVNITDWTNDSNVISVVTVPTIPPQENLEYSIDGIFFQPDPNFYGLSTGPYTVYVRDMYRCGIDSEEVYLLTYPKFFTPNGDNINDTWRIQYATAEPNMMVYIFDRYGKVITSFGASSTGWDGTYNGARLPATDYWFIVKRENGQELKGHFSMMR